MSSSSVFVGARNILDGGSVRQGRVRAPVSFLSSVEAPVYALPDILAGAGHLPVDRSRRAVDPTDIIFVNPEDGMPESFSISGRMKLASRGRLHKP